MSRTDKTTGIFLQYDLDRFAAYSRTLKFDLPNGKLAFLCIERFNHIGGFLATPSAPGVNDNTSFDTLIKSYYP